MDTHTITKEVLQKTPELLRYTLQVTPGAKSVEPEELASMLSDHDLRAPSLCGLVVSVFSVDYLLDTIVMVSLAKSTDVVVCTLEEMERALFLKP